MNLPSEISKLACELGDAAFSKICARLESAPSDTSANDALADIDDELAPWAVATLRAISASETRPDVLLLALRCAVTSVRNTRDYLGESDLVWSGPDAGAACVRKLEQALRDLILGAEQELWLVSFAAFRLPHLHDALRKAVERRVRLYFLLETTADSAGALSIDARAAFPPDLLAASRLYVWPLDKRARNAIGNPAKLHAKFAVADRHTALISSANLTADALERNMEAGVLLHGGPLPPRLSAHLTSLVEQGHLHVFTGAAQH